MRNHIDHKYITEILSQKNLTQEQINERLLETIARLLVDNIQVIKYQTSRIEHFGQKDILDLSK